MHKSGSNKRKLPFEEKFRIIDKLADEDVKRALLDVSSGSISTTTADNKFNNLPTSSLLENNRRKDAKAPIDSKEIERQSILLARHYDPRIRTFAVGRLAELCQRKEWRLDLTNYSQISSLCQNSDKNVRLQALKIVAQYAQYYPDIRIKNERGFLVRLNDDALVHVCSAMNDLEVSVRAEAAHILGSFTQVTDSFLHQTLDKKLLPQMKSTNVNSGGAPMDAGSSIWSTGKKLSDDVPLEKEDEAESIIPSSACGAFITALEDEYMVVRQPAVYSLGKLAINRPNFAIICIDHLADMFNDEIQQVRLDAIRSLTPIISHGTLQREQLNTILTALDDATADNRMALHILLGQANLADSGCVLHCLQTLLRSLRRFPLDKYSIYKCLSFIGRKHSSLIQSFVVELLGVHPVFDTPEQNIEDDFYLAKLILVLNAGSKHKALCSMIPEYVKKHYRYLRRSSPLLIPVISEFEESENISIDPTRLSLITTSLSNDPLEQLLRQSYEKVSAKMKKGLGKPEDPSDIDPEQTAKLIKVLDPSRESQNNDVIRFIAGMPTGVQLRCIITNLIAQEHRRFRIQVVYPDQIVEYFRPKPSDFLCLNSNTLRLQTSVVVSSKRWAYSAAIILTAGLLSHNSTKKDEPNKKRRQLFEPLHDADNPSKVNKISVIIHPLPRL